MIRVKRKIGGADMTAAEYVKSLAGRISAAEAEGLRRGEGLCISEFNRSICLKLLDAQGFDAGPVPSDKAAALETELRDYLNTYMADRPEGHKWIILACLYLAFIVRQPLHPQSAAKWVHRDGRYFCPSMEPDSVICGCCACERFDSLPDDAPRQGLPDI